MDKTIIKSTTSVVNNLVQLARAGESKLLVDYDQEADVLDINLGRPQESDDAQQGLDGIIRRKKNNKIIGLTVLNASQFSQANMVTTLQA